MFVKTNYWREYLDQVPVTVHREQSVKREKTNKLQQSVEQ